MRVVSAWPASATEGSATCGRLCPCRMVPAPPTPSAGRFQRADALTCLASETVRRPGHRRGHHRGRGGPGRGQPGAAGPPWSRRTTSPRGPRPSPRSWSTAGSATSSSTSTGWSTRTWPSASGSWTTRPIWCRPLPFLIPLFGRDGRGQPQRGPRLPHRPVALRPDRRDAHRPAPREGDPGAGPGPPADPARRPPGGRLPLLGRPSRRRPAHPDRRSAPPSSTTARWRPTTPGSPRLTTDADGRVRGARVRARRRRALRHPGLGGGQRRRRMVRRGPRPRRGPQPPLDPPGQGDPHHRARTRRSPATSPPSSRSGRTTGRSSSCRGATRSTSAPPTPSRTARSTTRAACPRTSTTSSTRPTPSPPGRSSRADITGIWAGLRPLLAPVEGRRAPSERTADLSRRHTVRTSDGGRGHRHRRQADHLPQDGRGHRRRRWSRSSGDGRSRA